MPEVYEIAEDETLPEIRDIADRGFEEAANLMLTLCQLNEREKHGKSRELPKLDRDWNPSSDMVHCGGNLQRLVSLANTGNGGYRCERNSGRKL